MPKLNVIRAAIDTENRVADRDALECSAGLIEAALEKIEIQARGVADAGAAGALADVINSLQCHAADLRVRAGEL